MNLNIKIAEPNNNHLPSYIETLPKNCIERIFTQVLSEEKGVSDFNNLKIVNKKIFEKTSAYRKDRIIEFCKDDLEFIQQKTKEALQMDSLSKTQCAVFKENAKEIYKSSVEVIIDKTAKNLFTDIKTTGNASRLAFNVKKILSAVTKIFTVILITSIICGVIGGAVVLPICISLKVAAAGALVFYTIGIPSIVAGSSLLIGLIFTRMLGNLVISAWHKKSIKNYTKATDKFLMHFKDMPNRNYLFISKLEQTATGKKLTKIAKITSKNRPFSEFETYSWTYLKCKSAEEYLQSLLFLLYKCYPNPDPKDTLALLNKHNL